ncbi:hypothetical protein [Mesorhizobium neociceri]|uniref:Uncharacterized protein n=1 Tax=Mesorhizobium neociceri TaxID=1307853 RepID=A0A838BEA6_9HYPH|nr:hypothetical protein [Mesorhizobium neociceri]MBA1144407.1 hypothetical protein [Mesorhizobium neociceri]
MAPRSKWLVACASKAAKGHGSNGLSRMLRSLHFDGSLCFSPSSNSVAALAVLFSTDRLCANLKLSNPAVEPKFQLPLLPQSSWRLSESTDMTWSKFDKNLSILRDIYFSPVKVA